MIEVFDRVPTYPGRVKLTPVAGQENTYDMVRNDAPTDPGTPLNRALFESIRTDVVALQHNVSDLITSHAQKTTVGVLVPGTEFVLFEDGIRVPFIKLAGEYSSTGRNLVIRKHIYKLDTLMTDVSGMNYSKSKTDTWLNDEVDGYIAKFDDLTRAALAKVPVEWCLNGKTEFLNRKAFLLSAEECGAESSYYFYIEGAPVEYFSTNTRRVAQFNGAAAPYWLRSSGNISNDVSGHGYVLARGTIDLAYSSDEENMFGIRPAFTLPADFEVDLSVPNTGNTMATAEVV